MIEKMSFLDKISVLKETVVKDSLGFKTHWKIEKFANDEIFRLGIPFEISDLEGNLALNEGLNALWTLLCGGTETAYNNASAQLGVGDSAVAEVATQADLQAATNFLWKAMDSGYPTYGTLQKATWKSTFGGTDANFAWNEFSVRNGVTANKNLNRKVSAQGTKTSGQTWILTLEITAS